MTYAELLDEVIERAFPEGYAANLRSLYEKRILDGLIEAQRWVPYLKQRQANLYPYGSTYYRQGTTVFCKPAGKVKRVCTFASKTLKDVVYYDYCSKEDIDRLTATRARLQEYPDAVAEAFGLFGADSTMDKGFRSERGLFCIDKAQIILLPHIESCERVMVDYDGQKTSFADADIVDYGAYQAQVIAALENWLRMKSASKDDRSTSDFEMLEYHWKQSISGLQLDTKNDTEPELPVEDIGILPRTLTPVEPEVNTSLYCNYDATNAYFPWLWLLADNGKYYDFGALALDGTVVELVSGAGLGGGKPEVTHETIRVAKVHFRADDENYYQLTVQDALSHGFTQVAATAPATTPCQAVAAINLDILGDDAATYYRLNLVMVDGVPVIEKTVAPAVSETEQVLPVCQSGNVFVLKDTVTQQCMYVRIKDGQLSISES